MQIVNSGNNMYSQNSQMRSAINAHSPLGRITHLEKEPSLSPDRMCAVLPAKWIKISVVLRSVICIWADPTQKDHPEKPLSRRQQVCSRFRATARVVPRLSHQTLDTLTKKSKTGKKWSEDTEIGTNLPSVPTGNCQLLLTEASRAWSGTRVPNHDNADTDTFRNRAHIQIQIRIQIDPAVRVARRSAPKVPGIKHSTA